MDAATNEIVLSPELILKLILALIAASGFWTFIGKIFDALMEKKKRKRDKTDKDATQEEAIKRIDEKQTVLEKMLRAVVRASMLGTYRDFEAAACKYIDKGEIPIQELQIIKETFDAYKDLGGNGFADNIMERVNELPIK